MIIKNKDGKFNVKIYDKGYVYMKELVNGEWNISEFNTEEEAQKALNDYKNLKK